MSERITTTSATLRDSASKLHSSASPILAAVFARRGVRGGGGSSACMESREWDDISGAAAESPAAMPPKG
eukprot:CAMPEP_0206042782 /NCGR_PEP_ID=MMETSP1466-20131121/6767_1 /ASSEMBLY_ACC=CAM_ASM_001126 /TAXON_ID=44452 /ORGANISM="Pavlova gyrans, Strain CCMP608" /LENGTH=69 /DNA_ID=CAMNT_0053417503 /DNA_START=398 /DNA_END=603 /DNA_ORIENTATION=-